jgi:hypothetical protein
MENSRQINGDLSGFSSTPQVKLLTPLSPFIGYYEILFKEAPAALRPDLKHLSVEFYQHAPRLVMAIADKNSNLYCLSR